MIKRLDHIGIAVEDLDAAIEKYKALTGIKIVKTENVAQQQVDVAFFPLKETSIELLQGTHSLSPITKFLNKKGGSVHHLCFEVDDIENTKAELSKSGFEFIKAASDKGAHGTKVAFIHPSSTGGVLLELVEYPKS